jgi:hypothetical protein
MMSHIPLQLYHVIINLALKWRLIWLLSLGRDTGKMSSLTRVPVKNRSVLNCSVVPNHDSLFLPLDASVEVCTPCNVLVEEVEDGVGFFFLETDDVSCD